MKTVQVIKKESKALFGQDYNTFPAGKPLWDFQRDGITPSFVDVFDNDKEQARLTYTLGISGRQTSIPLEFGTCAHWVLENADARGVADVLATGTGLTLDNWVNSAVTAYDEYWSTQVPNPSEAELDRQNKVYPLVAAHLPGYFRRWDGDYIGKYTYGKPRACPVKWIEREKEIAVPFHGGNPSGNWTTYLRGKRDGIFEDAKGRVWVMDHKCLSVIDEETTLDMMQLDFPMLYYGYTYFLETGKYPYGIVKNVIRKSQLRQKKSEDWHDYCARVKEDCDNPERWDYLKVDEDTGKGKSVGHYVRFEMALKPQEFKSWVETRLVPKLEHIQQWANGEAPHDPTDKNLVTKYGRAPLYNAILHGDYTDCYRRTKVFPELNYTPKTKETVSA